jgi:antirestriction protein ArdC
VSSSKLSVLTEEERAARREAERLMTQQAAEALLTSEGWQRWLCVRAQVALRRYSLTNQLLIALQAPDASRVAGFKAWLRLGYCVRKGEKGLRIFAPAPPSKKKLDEWRQAGADPNSKPRTRFVLTSVFDRAQVAELPPPAEPAPLDPPIAEIDGEDLEPLLGPLVELAEEIGSPVTFESVPGGALGFYELESRRIVIEAAQSPNGKVRTLLHELAHALLRAEPPEQDLELTYAEEELVVECAAHVVCSVVGFDTGTASIGYLASWSEGASLETIRSRAAVIDAIAGRLEAVVVPEDGPSSPAAQPAANAEAVAA